MTTKITKNEAAAALGRLNKGKPKQVSQEESRARADRLADARKKRWPVKKAEKKK